MAECTEEDCATDWAWEGAAWGGEMGVILCGHMDIFVSAPVGYLGLYTAVGLTRIWMHGHSHADSGVASGDCFAGALKLNPPMFFVGTVWGR